VKTPLLTVHGLCKSFGNRPLLDVAALALEAGESYVLTGENGCGKTTLLRIFAGLEPAVVEAASFDGRAVDLNAYPEWLRCQVVYVHQHPYLFRGTVVENIAYGLRARGVPAAVRKALVAEAVEWAGVDYLLDSEPHRLSGGEKQRVALARARVLNPRLFLLDEPTANLDADARRQTMKLIRDLCDANNTVVVACHDREIIELPHMHRLHVAGGRIDEGSALGIPA